MNIVADSDIPHLELFKTPGVQLTAVPGRSINHAAVKTADGLLIRSITRIDEALLKDTAIKWVGSLTAGTDHIDSDWLLAQNIKWQACAGFNAPPVADYVVGTIAALMNLDLLTTQKKRAAVIGVGQVGSRVADRLTILGFDVILVDPLRTEREATFIGTSLSTLTDVDLICIHTPLSKEGPHATYHMIDTDFMSRQKPGCVLLNAARGAVVDTHALLTHGKHLVVCLDVFENEPNINLDILNSTTIATPHLAGHAIESKWRGVTMLHDWTVANDWLPTSETTSAIKQQTISVDKKNITWQTIVQQVFDVKSLSDELCDTLRETDNIGANFDRIRKQHGNRHEFSNTRLVDVDHVTSDQLAILKRLGFIC